MVINLAIKNIFEKFKRVKTKSGTVVIAVLWLLFLFFSICVIFKQETVFAKGAYALNERPRLYLTKDKISDLGSKLKREPYRRFWGYTKCLADKFVNELPPCPLGTKPGDGLYSSCHGSIENFRSSTFRQLGDKIPFLSMAYLLTGDEAYLNAVKTWLDAFVQYDVWGVPNKSIENKLGYDIGSDLDAAHILFGISIAYDWLYDVFSEEELERYRQTITKHARFLYILHKDDLVWWADSYLQNHNYINMASVTVAGLALYGEEKDAELWLAESINNFDTVIGLLSPDGASHEGVGYWSYGMVALLQHYAAIKRYDVNEFDKFMNNKFFQNTALFRLYASLPDYKYNVDYADGSRWDFRGPGFILRMLASTFHDGRAQWLAGKVETVRGNDRGPLWLNLVWYDDSVKPIPPDDSPTYHYFDNLGILFSRTSWDDDATWAFYKAGQPQGYRAAKRGYMTGGHIHPDEGQFLLWSQGSWLIIEDGYVAPKFTKNHNVLLFNGKGQLGEGKWFNGKEVGSKIRVTKVFEALNKEYQYLITDIIGIYKLSDIGVKIDNSSYQRSFISLSNGIIVVRDDVHFDKDVEIKSLIHTTHYAIRADSRTVILNPVKSVVEAHDRSDKEFFVKNIYMGNISADSLHVVPFLNLEAYMIPDRDHHGSAGNYSGNLVSSTFKGKDVTLINLVAPNTVNDIDISKDGNLLKIKDTGKEHTINFKNRQVVSRIVSKKF